MNKAFAVLLVVSVATIGRCLDTLIPQGNWIYLFGLAIGTGCFTIAFSYFWLFED
jgi:hypothetical protein